MRGYSFRLWSYANADAQQECLFMCAYVVEESRVVLLSMDAGWKPDRSLARVDSSSIHVMLEARNVPALRDVRSSRAPRLCGLPTPFSLYFFFFCS